MSEPMTEEWKAEKRKKMRDAGLDWDDLADEVLRLRVELARHEAAWEWAHKNLSPFPIAFDKVCDLMDRDAAKESKS